eukprot:scaffold158980_cov33-Prasinocladus_malaysianus.AAC.1
MASHHYMFCGRVIPQETDAAEYAVSRAKEAEKTTEIAIQAGREEIRRLREDYDAAMAELTAMSRERENMRQKHESMLADMERERQVNSIPTAAFQYPNTSSSVILLRLTVQAIRQSLESEHISWKTEHEKAEKDLKELEARLDSRQKEIEKAASEAEIQISKRKVFIPVSTTKYLLVISEFPCLKDGHSHTSKVAVKAMANDRMHIFKAPPKRKKVLRHSNVYDTLTSREAQVHLVKLSGW